MNDKNVNLKVVLIFLPSPPPSSIVHDVSNSHVRRWPGRDLKEPFDCEIADIPQRNPKRGQTKTGCFAKRIIPGNEIVSLTEYFQSAFLF